MSEESPKLYAHKPKRAQLKQFQGQHKGKDFAVPPPSSSSSSAAAAASYSMGSSQNVPPSPPTPKESFARRYKFLWPLLLTVNLGVGAYVFMRTKKKDTSAADEENVSVQTPTTVVTTAPVSEKSLHESPIVEPAKLREPIPENQQRELYKWMLEEKRKVNLKNAEEKKLIDEEKAVLKQFIRAKTVPTL